MNNMNEAKLNNFPEVESYVIISCHNNSLFEYKDFYKLIITPFELELAFGENSYSPYFLLDGSNFEDFQEENIEENEKNFYQKNSCEKNICEKNFCGCK